VTGRTGDVAVELLWSCATI